MTSTATVRTLTLVGLAAAIAAFGCSKKDGETGAETGEKPAAQAAVPAAAKLDVPASIVGYGGTGDIKKTIASLHALATQVTPQLPPAAQVEQMIAAQIQNEFRLKDATALDMSKPLRVAFADPKAYGRDPSMLVVGITGKDKLVAALPELERKADDAGNAHSYLKFQGSKAPVYINFVGDTHVVFSRNAEVVGKHTGFLAALVGTDMPAHGGVFIEVDNLMALYGAQFDQGLAQAKREITQAAQATPSGAQSAAMVEAMVDWIGAHARQVDQLQSSLATTDKGVKLDIRISPKAGTDLAKLFELVKGADHPLLAKVPANSPAAMTYATDVKALAELTRRMGAMFIAPMMGEGADLSGYTQAMVDMVEATDGTFAMAVIDAPDGTGMTPVGLYGVDDAAKIRAAYAKVAAMNEDPAFKAMYEKTGVTVTVQGDAYKVGDVPVSVQTTTMANMPPEAMAMMAMMSDFMSQHVAFGDDLGVLGYGTAAKGVITQYLEGKVEGGFADKAGVKEALAQAAKNPSVFGYIEPLALAQRIKLGGMNPVAQMLAGLETDGGFAISMGAEGGVLQTVIYLPLKTVKQGVAAFEKNKGAF